MIKKLFQIYFFCLTFSAFIQEVIGSELERFDQLDDGLDHTIELKRSKRGRTWIWGMITHSLDFKDLIYDDYPLVC